MISKKEYKKAKKIVKEYKKQSSIVEDLVCDHRWEYISAKDGDIKFFKIYIK